MPQLQEHKTLIFQVTREIHLGISKQESEWISSTKFLWDNNFKGFVTLDLFDKFAHTYLQKSQDCCPIYFLNLENITRIGPFTT